MDLRIGICDDAPDWREKTRETVKHCTDQMANSVEIYSFQNGNELLSEEHPPMHILFMDIEMSDENGIDLAMEVNRKWSKCQVVYLTNYWSYAMEVYETRHVYYIVKEKFEEKLSGVLEKAIEQLRKQNRRVALQCHGGVKASLNLDDILYFERDRRVTYVITKEKEYTVDEKIPEIEERIASDDFVRCHTSFLVNFSYVKECTRKKLLLENGKTVDVSRSYWKKTEDAYVEWMKRWAR